MPEQLRAEYLHEELTHPDTCSPQTVDYLPQIVGLLPQTVGCLPETVGCPCEGVIK